MKVRINEIPTTDTSNLPKRITIVYGDNTTEVISDKYFMMDVWCLAPTLDFPINITREMLYHVYNTDGIYDNKQILKAATPMVEAIITKAKAEGKWNSVFFARLNRRRTDVFTKLYNKFAYEELRHIETFDGFDLMEITFHPVITEAREKLIYKHSPELVRELYDVVADVCYLPEMDNNELAVGFRRGEFKKEQFFQIMGCRGYVNDRKDRVYNYPITSSYGSGLKSMFEVITDSNGYPIALDKSTVSIATVSHETKKISVITTAVEYVEPVDCGSTDYHTVTVEYLENYIGVWYNNNGTLTCIRKGDTHLIGKTIDIRSPYLCKLDNSHNICEKCFGLTSDNLTHGRIVGLFVDSEITVSAKQFELSGKHLLVSVGISDVVITNNKDDILRVDGLDVYIDKCVDGVIRIPKGEFKGFHVIHSLDTLAGFEDYSSLSSVKQFTLVGNKTIERMGMSSGNSKTGLNLSKEFILYAIDNVKIYERYYTIPMPKKPMLLGSFTAKKDAGKGTVVSLLLKELISGTDDNPLDVIMRLMERSGGYYPYIATLVYAYSALSKEDGRLPRNDKGILPGNLSIVKNSTYSSSLPNDGPLKAIYSTTMLSEKNKRSSVSDGILSPEEVIKHRY